MRQNIQRDMQSLWTPYFGKCLNLRLLELIVWFSVIDDYSLVNFQPLDSSDEKSINYALAIIDTMLQWGEDQDVKVRDEEERDFENEMDELSLNDWALWLDFLPTEKYTAQSSMSFCNDSAFRLSDGGLRAE